MQEGYFSEKEPFTQSDGFNIAAGIVSLDSGDITSVTPSIENPEIGTLKMYRKTWDFFTNEELSFTEINTKFCSKDDFAEDFFDPT